MRDRFLSLSICLFLCCCSTDRTPAADLRVRRWFMNDSICESDSQRQKKRRQHRIIFLADTETLELRQRFQPLFCYCCTEENANSDVGVCFFICTSYTFFLKPDKYFCDVTRRVHMCVDMSCWDFVFLGHSSLHVSTNQCTSPAP